MFGPQVSYQNKSTGKFGIYNREDRAGCIPKKTRQFSCFLPRQDS